jgi:hypothetical protein
MEKSCESFFREGVIPRCRKTANRICPVVQNFESRRNPDPVTSLEGLGAKPAQCPNYGDKVKCGINDSDGLVPIAPQPEKKFLID